MRRLKKRSTGKAAQGGKGKRLFLVGEGACRPIASHQGKSSALLGTEGRRAGGGGAGCPYRDQERRGEGSTPQRRGKAAIQRREEKNAGRRFLKGSEGRWKKILTRRSRENWSWRRRPQSLSRGRDKFRKRKTDTLLGSEEKKKRRGEKATVPLQRKTDNLRVDEGEGVLLIGLRGRAGKNGTGRPKEIMVGKGKKAAARSVDEGGRGSGHKRRGDGKGTVCRHVSKKGTIKENG